MRVGIFCDSFFPENKAVAVRLYHLAEGLARNAGTQVVVHTSTRNENHRTLKYKVKSHFFPAPSNESSNLVRLFSELILGMEMFFRILVSPYQIVIISSPPFFASFFGVFAAVLRGIPYVFDVRDEYPEVFFTAGLIKPDSLFGRLLLSCERYIYGHALFIVTVTEGICSRIDLKLNSNKKSILVRNGYDEDLFKPSDIKEKKFTVVFHGNIGKFQDPGLILSVAQKVRTLTKDVVFKVIGYGNNDKILKEAQAVNVEFLGMIDYKDVPKVIASAHLGISFRSDDLISQNSFPVKLYEYIGVGIPVIVTPISEAGHFFEKNGIGFQFDSSDVDLLANKIVELSENEEYLRSFTSNILDVRPFFSRQQISNKFAQMLIKAIKTNI